MSSLYKFWKGRSVARCPRPGFF